MAQLLVHLPDELARRLERTVPAPQLDGFVRRLLERALPSEDDDSLHQVALAVEQDETLNADIAEWERATTADGLDGRP